jgi:hypothetical protein
MIADVTTGGQARADLTPEKLAGLLSRTRLECAGNKLAADFLAPHRFTEIILPL